VLAYSPETMDKSKGEWQTTIGNLVAEMTMEMGNPVFTKRTGRNIDICLLNHGGIRAILPKGNITTRTAFEIMPFENSLIVVELKGAQIREMANYILKEKKPHPLTGLKIIADKNTSTIKSLLVNNKLVDDNKTYFVGTSDYLSNGGDKMDFFKKGIQSHDMEYKLRNLMIDYFKKTDTIPVITTERIVFE
jgi:2',3'-cyclic-nucleotide 2'-phosphodiesterase (5'-nucleotidase family)